MKTNTQKRSNCPINFALEEFGDVWSLLIVRDIMLFGKTTYGEFLASSEKIATNILASRLEKLLQNEIITKAHNPSDKRKETYQLTQKGKELYPIMKEMMLWSAKYDKDTGLTPELTQIIRNEDQSIAQNKILEVYLQAQKSIEDHSK